MNFERFLVRDFARILSFANISVKSPEFVNLPADVSLQLFGRKITHIQKHIHILWKDIYKCVDGNFHGETFVKWINLKR